jgi:hypothetical protein
MATKKIETEEVENKEVKEVAKLSSAGTISANGFTIKNVGYNTLILEVTGEFFKTSFSSVISTKDITADIARIIKDKNIILKFIGSSNGQVQALANCLGTAEKNSSAPGNSYSVAISGCQVITSGTAGVHGFRIDLIYDYNGLVLTYTYV